MATRDTFWNRARTLAAQLVAEDELTDEKIAERCRHRRNWLAQLKHDDRFKLRVRGLQDQMRAELLERGVRERFNRVDALNDRHERMQKVIAARAEAPEMQDVPGGDTGLLVQRVKGVGGGDNFTIVHEYLVDTALLAELRATEKQAAEELGQWTEKRELTGKGGGPIILRWDDGTEA